MASDFFTFRKMITPVVVKFLFWVGLLLCLAGAFRSFFTGGAKGIVTGLITLLLGPIIVRVFCELLMLVFQVRDLLLEISHGGVPKV